MLQHVDYPRGLGILLPIFSLPSPYGIGTFGKAAYRFVDFLVKSGVDYWQILPLGPTGYGDSPYSGFSGFAGNPYFIDLDVLCAEGLLNWEKLQPVDFGSHDEYVNYALQFNNRYRVLRRAFETAKNISADSLYAYWEKEKDWLKDYALYMAIKREYLDTPWQEWPDALKYRDSKALSEFAENHADDLLFHTFLQMKFEEQWQQLKRYANGKGITIIGDLPIYVAGDSCDVWAHQEDFQLDKNSSPIIVSGAPPDLYAPEGQRWGNPVYDWVKMKKDGYSFWKKRIAQMLSLFDMIRLDHFIGFEHYWAVPAGDETAKNGTWVKGPGLDLFTELERTLGPLPMIVEDLGALTEEVIELRRRTGFPGMQMIQFAFDQWDNAYQPHHYEKRTSVYTSTHDSDPLAGWWGKLAPVQKQYIKEYFGITGNDDPIRGIIRGVASSTAQICVLQMQDALGLGSEARINIPGQLGGNWQWRLKPGLDLDETARRLKHLTELYGR